MGKYRKLGNEITLVLCSFILFFRVVYLEYAASSKLLPLISFCGLFIFANNIRILYKTVAGLISHWGFYYWLEEIMRQWFLSLIHNLLRQLYEEETGCERIVDTVLKKFRDFLDCKLYTLRYSEEMTQQYQQSCKR